MSFEILNNLDKNIQELILVTAIDTTAIITFYKRTLNDNWETLLETNGFIGKNGLGKVFEGDNKTPVGLYSFGLIFGISTNPGTTLPYTRVSDDMYWIDDSHSIYYNRLVDISKIKKDWNSAEHLIDEYTAYEYAIEINFNPDCNPKKGSAVFLHCSQNKPTAGCISIPTDKIKFIIKNMTKNTYIYIK